MISLFLFTLLSMNNDWVVRIDAGEHDRFLEPVIARVPDSLEGAFFLEGEEGQRPGQIFKSEGRKRICFLCPPMKAGEEVELLLSKQKGEALSGISIAEKEEGLVIRQKTPRRKRSCRYRGERTEISAPNQAWAMDFMSDRLFEGRPYRILTIIVCHSRESLAIEPRASFRAFHVVEVLDRLVRERGLPTTIRCDNGPEFAGRVLDQWAFFNRVELDFSRPARPTDNAHIESFNARLRQELLNAMWFTSLVDARACMETWRKEYNQDRPHTALQNRTPREFIEEARAAARVA